MENKLTKTNSYLTTYLNKSTKSSNEIATLKDLFDNLDKIPTLAVIKSESGDKQAMSIIIGGIYEMIEGLPHELNEKSILRLAKFILTNYKHLRPEEFNLIGDRLLSSKIYGKVNINTIATEIESYWQQRMDFAEQIAIERASKYKGDILSQDIMKVYEDLKKEKPVRKTNKMREHFGVNVEIIGGGKTYKVHESKLYEKAQELYKKYPDVKFIVKSYNGEKRLEDLVPK